MRLTNAATQLGEGYRSPKTRPQSSPAQTSKPERHSNWHILGIASACWLVSFNVLATEHSVVSAEACVYHCEREEGVQNAGAQKTENIVDPPRSFSGAASASAGYNSGIFKAYAYAEASVPEGSSGGYDPLLRPYGVTGIAHVVVRDTIMLFSPSALPDWVIKFREPALDGDLAAHNSVFSSGNTNAYFKSTVKIEAQSYSYLRAVDPYFGEHETSSGSLAFVYIAGTPVTLTVEVEARASAIPRATCFVIYCPGGSSDSEVDFAHTMTWAGISEIRSASDGSLITDWTLTSESGTNWGGSASTVPEVATFIYLLAGLLSMRAACKFGVGRRAC